MADEQGLSNFADGQFSRKVTGRAVKNLLANTGPDGRGFNARAAPPNSPELGDVYLADGTNWDPNAAGVPDLVAYDSGGGWTSIVTL